MIVSFGQIMIGAVLSATVITCVHVFTFPHLSLADQTRRINPVALQPVSWVLSTYVIVTSGEQLSVPVAYPVLEGCDESEQLIKTFEGQVISGSVSSTIQIICTQVDLLPHKSVADHVRRSTPVLLQPKIPDSSSV